MANFNFAIKVILRHEGGLVDNPADPGGVTNYGICFRLIKTEGIDIDRDGDVDADDIRNITREQASAIFKERFWDANNYGSIGDDVLATKIFDVCVNTGPKQAHVIVQRALCALGRQVTVDGALGPKSWAAIHACDPKKLTQAICEAQAAFYIALASKRPQLSQFLKGWLKRASWAG